MIQRDPSYPAHVPVTLADIKIVGGYEADLEEVNRIAALSPLYPLGSCVLRARLDPGATPPYVPNERSRVLGGEKRALR